MQGQGIGRGDETVIDFTTQQAIDHIVERRTQQLRDEVDSMFGWVVDRLAEAEQERGRESTVSVMAGAGAMAVHMLKGMERTKAPKEERSEETERPPIVWGDCYNVTTRCAERHAYHVKRSNGMSGAFRRTLCERYLPLSPPKPTDAEVCVDCQRRVAKEKMDRAKEDAIEALRRWHHGLARQEQPLIDAMRRIEQQEQELAHLAESRGDK